jgi:hypothetical protein
MPLTLFRLFAAVALLGLLLAPLGRPLMADTGMSSAVAAQDGADMSGDSASAMPAGMPCCPDDTPMPDCSKHCQMAMCAPGVVLSLPALGWSFLSSPASSNLGVHQEPAPSGVSIAPLPKPPRV